MSSVNTSPGFHVRRISQYGWPGETAYGLCRSIYQQILSASDQYVTTILQQEQASVHAVRTEYKQRFAA